MPMIENPGISDVEASGLGAMSYPFEIGVAMNDGGNFCALMMPAQDWTHWGDEAKRIQRAPQDILETYRKSMRAVADGLNILLAGHIVYPEG